MEEILLNAGYDVYGSNSSFFQTNSAEDARFSIAGTITDARFDSLESKNIFTPGAWRTEGELTVRWEVLDTVENSVVFDQEFSGSAAVDGQEVLAAVYEATKDSFGKMVSEFQ